ncbi:MAG TPA: hypothetical protein VIP31_09935 [Acidovorax sp.]
MGVHWFCEATQRGTLDVPPWLDWVLAFLLRAVLGRVSEVCREFLSEMGLKRFVYQRCVLRNQDCSISGCCEIPRHGGILRMVTPWPVFCACNGLLYRVK